MVSAGRQLADIIEAVGKDVKRFTVGDTVFGTPGIAFGAHAEYTCVPEDGVLTIKPAKMTWEEAAAVFLGASTALFFLRDQGKIQSGQKILIYGASGGIGAYAVQLARYFGAHVSAVCSTANQAMVQSFGADEVIDYTKDDWESWTGMVFPESGAYVVRHALQPIQIEVGSNSGVYHEPNVWMQHPIP